MTLDLIAIDLAKRSFHLHGIDRDGVVLSRKIGRDKLFAAIGELARLVLPRRLSRCALLGQRFQEAGFHVRLIYAAQTRRGSNRRWMNDQWHVIWPQTDDIRGTAERAIYKQLATYNQRMDAIEPRSTAPAERSFP